MTLIYKRSTVLVVFGSAMMICLVFLAFVTIRNTLCDTTTSLVVSPDQKYEAEVSTIECGAFDSGSTSISLRRRWIFGLFHEVYSQTSNPFLRMIWKSDKDVLIITGKPRNVYLSQTTWNNIAIKVNAF